MKFPIFLILTGCLASIASLPLPVPDEEVARSFSSDNQTVLIDKAGNFISIEQPAGKLVETKGKTTDKNDIFVSISRNEVPSKAIHPQMHSIPDIEKQTTLTVATHKELPNINQEKQASEIDVVKSETESNTLVTVQSESESEYTTLSPTMDIQSIIDKIHDNKLSENNPIADLERIQELTTPPTNVSSMEPKVTLDKSAA
ncbi:uncharacterized protein LOC132796128 [Drosophila nasuta]|uniref:uncharacterized protein LOC132796128 n=1 Tax=Drosophila nasuta TaxID=42062 RepID=UPI00295EFB11|nr:uncharacterized protein LOC132796128 [Drosophila nasuta]